MVVSKETVGIRSVRGDVLYGTFNKLIQMAPFALTFVNSLTTNIVTFERKARIGKH